MEFREPIDEFNKEQDNRKEEGNTKFKIKKGNNIETQSKIKKQIVSYIG
ncbi:unnamed protein product (macronuclear) [Paramecium tetraurelia]|uniref:Uncharacterized protein n=1 Tax=Paramecium tetraurelia TaxID=5888 RepID=A0DWZ9_PARTE|nr:uncharacterized protein GSPATT00021198001 [Paramecium tetraurelia]CAK87566.1 unnamed protein product [Paramecium tetraurelia]|eukprot:XP_001454963.1 hypothetical protein (macronuclear) [Paramecium tetraurelia strain d4-2]